MPDAAKFYNRGFGWICVQCENGAAPKAAARSRLMREGEAESKTASLTNDALARWADSGRTTLVCPRCGNSEKIKP